MTAARTTLLTDGDLHLFGEGTHRRIHEKLGAHPRPDGTHFAVWAPNARAVSVVGDFNGWDPFVHPLKPRSNGTKSVSVTLPVSQRYAFRYLDENGQWLDDEAAHEYVDNGAGGVNSVVLT
jgi:1,4-alpha-glucan branching enzyme